MSDCYNAKLIKHRKAPWPPKDSFQTLATPITHMKNKSPSCCIMCNQQRHHSSVWLLCKYTHLAENFDDLEYTSKESGEEKKEETKLVRGDEGDSLMCVVQKTMLSPKHPYTTHKNSWFQTRRTIQNKVCATIFDNCSYENIVTKSLVKSLQLSTMDRSRNKLKSLLMKHARYLSQLVKINWMRSFAILWTWMLAMSCEEDHDNMIDRWSSTERITLTRSLGKEIKFCCYLLCPLMLSYLNSTQYSWFHVPTRDSTVFLLICLNNSQTSQIRGY